MGIILNAMRKIVYKADDKNKPVMMCTRPNTRNRYKNDKYKIPADQPQCTIFKDNRCCGGCRLAPTCDHVVDCNCYGFTKGQMGVKNKRAKGRNDRAMWRMQFIWTRMPFRIYKMSLWN